jgi:hypothetical protein
VKTTFKKFLFFRVNPFSQNDQNYPPTPHNCLFAHYVMHISQMGTYKRDRPHSVLTNYKKLGQTEEIFISFQVTSAQQEVLKVIVKIIPEEMVNYHKVDKYCDIRKCQPIHEKNEQKLLVDHSFQHYSLNVTVSLPVSYPCAH